ncbi:hypothetical protein CWO85_01710 [Candidatus Phytoplasma ziziphi]|uniref:Uncharacterized protein n=1 Tax=Ziziphus jujuba witches'-broom phytoplasma TaxID=135727 RepID=A0A660HMZ1_ZIZJU|nr:hypothetical protein [Candidatus Phytoplasma ziziphi]AYJ01239.1 hypothetical protein CWO85_01710 [Candidatus Phytoplasma ziziphi]
MQNKKNQKMTKQDNVVVDEAQYFSTVDYSLDEYELSERKHGVISVLEAVEQELDNLGYNAEINFESKNSKLIKKIENEVNEKISEPAKKASNYVKKAKRLLWDVQNDKNAIIYCFINLSLFQNY